MSKIQGVINQHAEALISTLNPKLIKFYKDLKKLKGLTLIKGPPYATAGVHIGTIYNQILKDFYVRYFINAGYQVSAPRSFDMHGLPIAVLVEKKGNWTRQALSKNPIKFIDQCRNFANSNRAKMLKELKILKLAEPPNSGWATNQPYYMELALKTFKKIFDSGHAYKKLRISNVCTRCATSLSDSELEWTDSVTNMHYHTFVAGQEGKLVIGTSSPWSLPGNVGVAYNKNIVYVRLHIQGVKGVTKYILSKKSVKKFLQITNSKVLNIENYDTKKFENLTYTNHNLENKKMYHADFVVSVVGTGLVHISPSNGLEDSKLAKKHKIKYSSFIGLNGQYKAGKHKNYKISDTSYWTSSKFGHLGKFTYTHRHAKCWRCNAKITYLEIPEWYINANPVGLDEALMGTNWNVNHAKLELIKNLKLWPDWCISRNRLWGIALPIWTCTKCKKSHCHLPKTDNYYTVDLDKLVYFCDCGSTEPLKRQPGIFDVWFDSGAAHNIADITKPVIICEGVDQVRGWFRSLAISSYLDTGRVVYDQVVCHGFIDHAKGVKWSKSKSKEQMGNKTIFEFLPANLSVVRAGLLMQPLGKRFMMPNFNTGSKYINVLDNLNKILNFYNLIPPKYANLYLFTCKWADLSPLDQWILLETIIMYHTAKRLMLKLQADKYCVHLVNFTIQILSQKYIKYAKGDIKTHSKIISLLVGVMNTLSMPITGNTPPANSRVEIYQFERLIANLLPEYYSCATDLILEQSYLKKLKIESKELPKSYVLDWSGRHPIKMLNSKVLATAIINLMPRIRQLKKEKKISIGEWVSEIVLDGSQLMDNFKNFAISEGNLKHSRVPIKIDTINELIGGISHIFKCEKILLTLKHGQNGFGKITILKSLKTDRLNRLRAVKKKIAAIRKILSLRPGKILLLNAPKLFEQAIKIGHNLLDSKMLTTPSSKRVLFEGVHYEYEIIN